MTDADSVLVDDVRQRLRAEAEAEAAEEPRLVAAIQKSVLQHSSLQGALAAGIAPLLEDELGSVRLSELAEGMCAEEPEIVVAAAADLEAFVARDPSCGGLLDVLMNYKGFRGLVCHRLAHALWTRNRVSLARYLRGRVANVLAMDFHPAARIGRAVFIDHGTGIVIGETAVVENNVSMLHSVTLGGTGKTGGDRHPKIREGVMIGAGAKILGNIEIGSYSKIAAGSVVLRSVPSHCTAAGVPARVVGRSREEQPYLAMDQDIENPEPSTPSD